MRTPHTSESETETENEVYVAFWAKDEVKYLGTSERKEGHSQDDKSRCSASNSLRCHIDKS